jgi:hypothetical protein
MVITKVKELEKLRKKTKNTLWFRNFYASKLQKGTEIFSTNQEYIIGDAPFVILVELGGELIDYHALIEG